MGAPSRLPPDGVDQAPDHVRPHVFELDPANSSSLPDDGDACGPHRVRARQPSQESRHRNLRIAPIIARRPRASRSADLRSPGSRHHSARPREPHPGQFSIGAFPITLPLRRWRGLPRPARPCAAATPPRRSEPDWPARASAAGCRAERLQLVLAISRVACAGCRGRQRVSRRALGRRSRRAPRVAPGRAPAVRRGVLTALRSPAP